MQNHSCWCKIIHVDALSLLMCVRRKKTWPKTERSSFPYNVRKLKERREIVNLRTLSRFSEQEWHRSFVNWNTHKQQSERSFSGHAYFLWNCRGRARSAKDFLVCTNHGKYNLQLTVKCLIGEGSWLSPHALYIQSNTAATLEIEVLKTSNF